MLLINNKIISKALLLSVSLCCMHQLKAQQKPGKDPILSAFQSPPNESKPRVWWHWMNGNISKEGIRKDLEWMHRSGIGGFQNFDASLMTPQIVEKRLTYMTPEWQDAFQFTTRLADSLKLEMAIAGSPGWSETGGPWVKHEDGMKKIVWTETRVSGGSSNIRLAPQKGSTGPFQDISKQPEFGELPGYAKMPDFYRDIALLAIRLPENDRSLEELGAAITSSSGNFNLRQLTDGNLAATQLLPKDTITGYAWIQFAFPKPQTIKGITMVGGGEPGMFGMGADPADSRILEASDDGINYRFITNIPPGAILQQTLTFPAITARYFRVKVKNPPMKFNSLAAMVGIQVEPVSPPGTDIAEIVLHPVERINRFEEKAAFAPVGDLHTKPTAHTNDVVHPNDIIDLTGKLNADGSINWTAPSGNWKLIRFGYSLLGINNHPASPEATGPEVDKLDPVAIRNYFNNYLNQYQQATGGLMGKAGGLQYIITDSWEAGAQNWTPNLPAEFEKRRGYSLLKWLPVITGQVIHGSEESERFLFDFRKTLSEMVSEYHYDALTDILEERGMKRYTESHESGRAMIADGMDVKRKAAVPMSALWTPNPYINQADQTKYTMDIRESASVAHIYGQNLVAAESLTALGLPSGAWSYSPENLKSSVDLELASGLNRFVIHCSVHQPSDEKIPGLGLGPFGQWYTRHETWSAQATAWNDYLSRSSYLLQQGKFVADILYYYGEDNNITSLFSNKTPDIPEGYNYDFINTHALLNLVSVKDGSFITTSNMRYRVLVLDSNARRMPLAVLKKIATLVRAGGVVTGIRPEASPSLADDPAAFTSLVNEIWGGTNKKVYTGKSLEKVLQSLAVTPDMSYSSPSGTKLLFVHRSLPDRDIYWVNNRSDKKQWIDVTFRVAGKKPMLWRPESGAVEELAYSIANGNTTVKIPFEPQDAVFVVFRDKATSSSLALTEKAETTVAEVNGKWKLEFQEGRGAPASITLDKLQGLQHHPQDGVKYFSGTTTYTNTIRLSAAQLASKGAYWLDLGEMKDLAEVKVNGKPLGIIWKKPYRVNLKDALKAGDNSLEIKVVNLWVNRLIGDQQPGARKITYTTMAFYQADAPLLPSGLMGPVRILNIK